MAQFTSFLSLILSFMIGFFTYPISFIPTENDTEFHVSQSDFAIESIFVDGQAAEESAELEFSDSLKIEISNYSCGWYNYYAVSYSSDAHLKGVITYRTGVTEKSEEFFLEKADSTEFFSFIDNCLKGTKANALLSIEFYPLDKDTAKMSFYGVSVFNREIPEREVFISNEYLKLGVDLQWGGALSYLEDLDSGVQAVKHEGRIKVDSNAAERYSSQSVNNNVNLINRYDPGRLVQQSYYGTSGYGYVCGEFMGNQWGYNPVQGGNQFNDSSKIVDLRIEENKLYVKCRPLDWAKEKEHITPSYMEASYTLDGKLAHTTCRFIDFSGYQGIVASQEIPAFYCIEPFNRYVYYGGEKPWTGDALTVEPELIFWPDAGYPNFTATENWSAFIGEFDDSFGIGLYTPNETVFLSGVFNREKTQNTDPSKDATTSYIALVKHMMFQSFSPIEYDYYLTTGDTAEIRENFSVLK